MQFPSHIRYIFSFRPAQQGKRYAWIDYAKGIAIILVVYRHVAYGLLHSGLSVSSLIVDANEMLYSFRMPLFFFLSGLFFSAGIRKRGPQNFFINKVNILLYPYVLWCLIQLTLQLIFSAYTNSKREVIEYLDILIQPRNMLQQWYIFALFNVTALYLFTNVVLKLKPVMQIALGIVLLWLAPYVNSISTFYDIFLHYIFFCLGHLTASWFFRESVQQKLASGYGALLMLPVFLLTQYYFLRHQNMNLFLYAIIALLGSLLVVMIAFLLAKHGKLEFLRIIGFYSFYIYLLHVGIIFLVRSLILRTGVITNVPAMTVILTVSGIFFSIVLYRTCLLLKMNFLFVGPFKENGIAYTAVPEK